MPADFELDTATRRVLSRSWGNLTDEDLIGHMERIRELFVDGTLDPAWTQIADFNDVENLDGVTTLGIRRLAKQNPWPVGSFRALIVQSDLVFGLGRMYQLMGEEKGDYVGIVRNQEDALAWVMQTDSIPDDASRPTGG